MPSVSNLSIKRQTGSDTHYATWSFDGAMNIVTVKGSAGGVDVGSLVSIRDGATYYNGVDIPDWVMEQRWYVLQITGDRAVINENEDGSHHIMSPINVEDLIGDEGNYEEETETIQTLDHYTVEWFYDTGDGIWFVGSSGSEDTEQSTYSAPSNALRIKVKVTPVSKTHTVNDEDTYYWIGSAESVEYGVEADPPEKTSTPSVSVDKYKLTVTLENISDPRTDEVKYEIYNGTTLYNTGIVTVLTRQAIYTCNVEAGGEYRVRAASINIFNNSKIYGEWSDFSSSVGTIPSTPAGITNIKASSRTSIHLEWSEVKSATSYDIEYATKKEYLDGSDGTSTVTGIQYTRYEKTGLETGNEYFFRVRAVNDKGTSDWSEIKSIIIGKDPAAPTTWSSTTTAVTGEPLTLYWVHNTEDNSSQTFAELELYINGNKDTKTIKNTTDEDEKDKTSSYKIDTSQYTEGTIIQWRVRTAGVTMSYGDWSVMRTVDIYAPATLSMKLVNKDNDAITVLSTFPFYVSALPGPKTQAPISYHLTIKSNEIYQTIDQVGNVKMVNKGEEIYSKYFDINTALLVELSANNLDLENNISYTVTCLVAMNSGLTAEASQEFTVHWVETKYEPSAELSINKSNYSAYIRPYCVNSKGVPNTNVILGVYRREFDGAFTEIASNLTNGKNIHVTDPHPALDYARYRITATDKNTGAVSYYDPPGYPIKGKSIIIQWNEEWSTFDTGNSDAMEKPAWAGSLLSLPYNIDISDNSNPDVELIEYIGRMHPVSYYGTQKGSTSTWNTDIPKTDKDRLYAIRRLSIYMGDVYVREPSGTGYWANIKVSYSRKHKELTIPVTFTVTRVEGGM